MYATAVQFADRPPNPKVPGAVVVVVAATDTSLVATSELKVRLERKLHSC